MHWTENPENPVQLWGPPQQKKEDSIAQLVEHHTFNVGVTSSSLVGVTKAMLANPIAFS